MFAKEELKCLIVAALVEMLMVIVGNFRDKL
jgi:hypothetical protein